MARRHDSIELSIVEKIAVNLCAPADALDAFNIRSWYNKKPSAFQSYYAKDNAITPFQKMVSMWNAKIDKTKKIIYQMQKNEGLVKKREKAICNYTLCGRISLYIAYSNYLSNNK